MRLVGLTGGIGSGKSSVASRLAERGAAIVDADAIVRELQEPGQPVLAAMVERFGPGILTDEGRLDRAAVAAVVFADAEERAALEAIVHPALAVEMRRRLDALAVEVDDAGRDRVVILDHPLLTEKGGKAGHSAVIVVDTPPETAVERLVAHRGFREEDARARMAAQASREERLAIADFVVDNSGAESALDAEVDRCWAWLATLEATPWPPD